MRHEAEPRDIGFPAAHHDIGGRCFINHVRRPRHIVDTQKASLFDISYFTCQMNPD
jgi:hypothetical protein